MTILFDEQINDELSGVPAKKPAAIFADLEKRDFVLSALGISTEPVFLDSRSKTIRFESRNEYDYAAIHMPDFSNHVIDPLFVELFITKDILLVLGNESALKELKTVVAPEGNADTSPVQLLSALIGHILSQYDALLEDIDNKIEILEERAMAKKPKDHTATIIALRKQLLSLKRFFESMYDLLEELEGNQNSLFSKVQLQAFRVHKNKANRQLNGVLSLREYLTQVREAFQNQLDISLNDTMRFFTVITAIFLPLTLVVGWYGMNLHMPETEFGFTYPMVIIASLLFIVISLIFCKKKGWF